ncbi:MAG: aspartate-semialdehyde dehydrogenase [Erysipelotrichaceae bacterium]
MKQVHIAILGATGAVGKTMLKVLEERKFPIKQLTLLASERSVGSVMKYHNQDLSIELACPDAFKGVDIVLGAVSNEMAIYFAPFIKAAHALFIDNSSAFRMEKHVPLVVPEINAEDAYKHQGIISNPNCSTIITCMAIYNLARLSPITHMFTATYQAVSGAGQAGLDELLNQTDAFANKQDLEFSTFSEPILHNVIPLIADRLVNGYTSEEMKMQDESRKILHLPKLKVSCTCVRVPVLQSHSIAISIQTKDLISLEDAEKQLSLTKGLIYSSIDLPTPFRTSYQDKVLVGRLRSDLVFKNGLSLFACGDQLRKGAATNAIQIAELFI